MWAALASVAASAVQNGGPKPMAGAGGQPQMINPSVSVEAMRINQTDWKLYALLGFGALLVWKVVK